MNSPHPTPDTEQFTGGVNHVIRVADKVLRPTGPWTPAVHALLNHLTSPPIAFTSAPTAYGIDPDGREILEFIPGEVPESDYICSDAALHTVGTMLRALHDATTTFVAPPSAHWYLPAREPAEVICHGDVAPYNTVFRDGLPVAFIDFDTAHPAPRLWDVAYAAFRFVPLSDPFASTQITRLRILADAYGLTARERLDLPAVAEARLHALAAHIREQTAAGNAAFAAHQAAGHDTYYINTAAYIRAHASEFQSALA